MGVNVYEWLNEIKLLGELIDAKKAEVILLINTKITECRRIREKAEGISANMDGMPHTSGASDKVGTLVGKLVDIEAEFNEKIDESVSQLNKQIEEYEKLKADIIVALKKLPPKHFGVMYRRYILRMKNEAIAADMHYSTVQIWRIKKEAVKMLKDVIVCNVDMNL